MNTEELNKLIQLYREGRTTLEEEELLRNHPGTGLHSEGPWLKFAGSNRKDTPAGLEADVISLIRERQGKKRRLALRFGYAAAIIIAAFISVVLITPVRQGVMTYDEKVEAMKEAFDLLEPTLTAEAGKEIIYEDDILIIYLK